MKTYGNIVAFRDLEEETNAALELFGNKDARGVVLLKPYGDYYGEYVDKVTELLTHFPIGQQIVGEQAQKDFIQLFGAILRLQNILTSFDDFDGNDPLTERQADDYAASTCGYTMIHARSMTATEKSSTTTSCSRSRSSSSRSRSTSTTS